MSAAPGAPDEASLYCPWCGRAETDGGHEKCLRRLVWLDPPRYCAQCARRMVVQVSPSGWTARCSRHGELDAERWRARQAAPGG